jgi:solute carrier family 25, member 34/35
LNGCRLGFYEPIRSRLAKLTFGSPDKSNAAINMVSGATSGIMGACLGSPFFLVKTRLQSYSPVFPVGTQHVYKGAFDAFRHIWKEGGLRGLYRGLDAAAIRTGMGSSVQLPVYNWAKKTIEKYALITDGPMKHIAASACSGVGVCIAMHPGTSHTIIANFQPTLS